MDAPLDPDYSARNQIKLLNILYGLGLAKAGLWHGSRGKGYSLLPGWEGQLLAPFPPLCCWDLPLLHFLHLEINEFRSVTRPPSIYCRLAVNTELEMGLGRGSLGPAAVWGLIWEAGASG